MNDLISRQAAIDALGEEPLVWDENDDYDVATRNQWRYDVECIKEVPTAEPERKGEWIVYYDEECPQDGIFKCPICGQIISVDTPIPLNFCPNCGTDMRS